MSADLAATVVGLARTARAGGVEAGTGRVVEMVRALGALDATSVDDVYWAGRLTLCGSPQDVARYDAAFAAYFDAGRRPRAPRGRPPAHRASLRLADAAPGAASADADDAAPLVTVGASTTEVLRHRDVSVLAPSEREALARLFAAFRLSGEPRVTRRHAPARRGGVDRARSVRALLQAGGEPARLRYRRQRRRPRRVILLLDVSGSMRPYADSLLRFAHAASRRGAVATEAFTVGTRLTRISRELAIGDADAAMAAVAHAVPDWSGGTRLGVLLREFLDVWGQRGMARGAIVVILSDGWERDDPRLLAEQMARLQRLAHRVVWANPRKGRAGYAPLAQGMAAALPHVDDFVEGHSLAALERLALIVSGAGRRA